MAFLYTVVTSPQRCKASASWQHNKDLSGANPDAASLHKLTFHNALKPRKDGLTSVLLCCANIMAREFARSFYSSKAWQDCRNEYAKSVHHLCENCMRKGIYRPGVIVHHIEELTPMNIHRPEVALNFDNLELLCRECHAEQHMERSKGRRYVFGDDGEIIVK